jgi:FixJ family two-component response regulator
MEKQKSAPINRRVLAVDDEPVARQQLAFQLSALGYLASLAASADEAREILVREGAASFDCLITDCWMPEQSGLDLIRWLRNVDPTLASIVISNAGDKNVITRTLRDGASDFLEKPVFRNELDPSLERAVQSTQRRRRQAATNSAVKEAGLVQRRMNNPRLTENLPASTTICYHPCHDAGGDSVSLFPTGPGRMLVVVADVSGHDLKSAFVSAYFQGTLRAMVEQKIPVAAILDNFNRFLINEWSLDDSSAEITSLSVCAATIDVNAGSINLLNSGFPLPSLVDRHGRPARCGVEGGNPLGWFDPNPISDTAREIDAADRLFMWTDGLEDFAHQMQISEWSLAFAVLRDREKRPAPEWLADAPDDVLLLAVGFDQSQSGIRLFPIVSESYEKAQAGDIDELQDQWKRSLEFAFPDVAPEFCPTVLLCAREAILNGLSHGCSGNTDRCSLLMVFDMDRGELRVEVNDPGPGHHFDHRVHASGELLENHRGLALMCGLPQRVEKNLTGSAIRMFFSLESLQPA